MAPGGGRLDLDVRKKEKENEVLISVADTGPGIPEESREAVFGEFTRLSASKHEDGGIGLGLTIVRKVAQTLGTDVSLRSRRGGGCVFSVAIPRAAPTALTEVRPDFRKNSVRTGLRILCVDNEPVILRGLRALGLNIDILPPDTGDLSAYRLVLVPRPATLAKRRLPTRKYTGCGRTRSALFRAPDGRRDTPGRPPGSARPRRRSRALRAGA